MGYMELKGTDQAIAQSLIKQVLDHEDTVTMVVLGADEAAIAERGKVAADNSPSTWWVVWVQNLALLTEQQQKDYTGKTKKSVVCFLSSSDQPVRFLGRIQAESVNELIDGFLAAEAAA